MVLHQFQACSFAFPTPRSLQPLLLAPDALFSQVVMGGIPRASKLGDLTYSSHQQMQSKEARMEDASSMTRGLQGCVGRVPCFTWIDILLQPLYVIKANWKTNNIQTLDCTFSSFSATS